MAAISNTFVSTSAVGNREDLSDVVSRITPEDTPIVSAIGSMKSSNTYTEWEIDELAAPAANAQAEGDQYAYTAITPPARVGNYQQIFRKDALVSRTQEAITNAGMVEKLKYTVLKRGIELRKDKEYAILIPNASKKSDPRELGSLSSWYTTNDLRGTNGSDGGFSSGATSAPTDGTQRAFTKALMDSVMQSIYEAGGTPKLMVCSPYVKSVFVTFMSDSNVAPFRNPTSKGADRAIIGTVDMYEGPFGNISVVPDRVMVSTSTASTNQGMARNAHFIDPEYLKWSALRKMRSVTPAETSDAVKRILIEEGTLCVKNEAACGVVADIFGVSATA